MITWDYLEQQWPQFTADIEQLLKQLQLWPVNYHIDHIAFRTNDSHDTHSLWQQTQAEGAKLCSEAVVNGRPIYVFESTKPWQLFGQEVSLIEMPFPGSKQYPKQGWEHIELVIPAQANSIDEFKQQLAQQLPNIEATAISIGAKLKWSMPEAEGEQKANPTLAIKHNGVCVKLHPISLKEVISS